MTKRPDPIDDPLLEVIREVRKVVPDATPDIVLRLRVNGDLPCVKIGRAYFARKSKIEAYTQKLLEATA